MKTTKLFLDTEFTGLHKKTTLISLGIVSECGKSFYAEFTDYDTSQVNDWIRDNVISGLRLTEPSFHFWTNRLHGSNLLCCGDTYFVRTELQLFLAHFEQIEIWSDCLAYDWVLFNDIFGHAFNIPKNINYIPLDICTLFKERGLDPDTSREDFIININESYSWDAKLFGPNPKHNSLYDAFVIRACYNKLMIKTLPVLIENCFPDNETILDEAEGRYPVKRHMTPDNSPYVGIQKTFIHGVRYALGYVADKWLQNINNPVNYSGDSEWIRIKSASDLPTEDCRYWIAKESAIYSIFATKEGVANKFQNGTITHYKKLVEPQNPNA